MVNLASSSRGSRDSINRFNSASESTALAVTVEPSSVTQGSESEDVFGRESFIKFLELLLTFIQRSADNVVSRERKTHGRSESPKESPQCDELVSHSLPSPHFTVQGIPGFGITNRTIVNSALAFPPVILHFPYMDVYTPARQTGSKYAPSFLPNPATSSSYGSVDPSGEGPSGTSPTFEGKE